MSSYVKRAGLQVDERLAGFVETEALKGLDLASDRFWAGFAEMASWRRGDNTTPGAVRRCSRGPAIFLMRRFRCSGSSIGP